MTLDGRHILVVGLGRSGVAAVRFLASRGARVTVTDARSADELPDALAQVAGGDVVFELGGHRKESFRTHELVVVSPGVGAIPELAVARAAGVEVIGEYELACRHLRGTLVAITGTNGKSTTTSLLGHLLGHLQQRPTFVGGNLGTPLCEALDTSAASADGIVVAEASSFQLETARQAHAHVAVLLNVTEDHLDRYADFAAYAAAKQKVFANQTDSDWAIVRTDLAADTAARMMRFSSTAMPPPAPGASNDTAPLHAWLDDQHLVMADQRISIADIPLVGRHNYENTMAALLAAHALGVPLQNAQAALRTFRPLPHRMEPVGRCAGIEFFDDSKATNVGSVVGSLDGFPQPFVWLGGGRDKGGDYAPLRRVLQGHARAAVLIGEAREKIARAVDDLIPVEMAVDMNDAVRRAFLRACAGDAVVLSPACSSFDMYRNYEERGRMFRAAVSQLAKEVA